MKLILKQIQSSLFVISCSNLSLRKVSCNFSLKYAIELFMAHPKSKLTHTLRAYFGNYIFN